MPPLSRRIGVRSLLAASFSLVVLFGCTAAPASAPPSQSALRQILSPEEFTAAGLDKLTPEELDRLAAALIQHNQLPAAGKQAGRPAEAPATAADFGAEQVIRQHPPGTGNELRAHIDGSVQDITGRTLFLLDNGQIWQQRIPDQFHLVRKLVNPEVVITRGLVGYKMTITGANIVLFVKRIQ